MRALLLALFLLAPVAAHGGEFQGGTTGGGGWVDGAVGENSFAIACNGDGSDFMVGGTLPDIGSAGYYCSSTQNDLFKIDENRTGGRILSSRRQCWSVSDTGAAVNEWFISQEGYLMGSTMQIVTQDPDLTGGNGDRGVILAPNVGFTNFRIANVYIMAGTPVSSWAGFTTGETRTLTLHRIDTASNTTAAVQTFDLTYDEANAAVMNWYIPASWPAAGVELAATTARGFGLQWTAESAATGVMMRLSVCMDIEELDT